MRHKNDSIDISSERTETEHFISGQDGLSSSRCDVINSCGQFMSNQNPSFSFFSLSIVSSIHSFTGSKHGDPLIPMTAASSVGGDISTYAVHFGSLRFKFFCSHRF